MLTSLYGAASIHLYAQDVLSGTSPYDSGVAPINDQTGNNTRPAAYHSQPSPVITNALNDAKTPSGNR